MFDTLQGGMYLFQIMDWYAAAFSAMVIAFLECLVVAWIYSECCLTKYLACVEIAGGKLLNVNGTSVQMK
jgi:hypothetical protein